MPKPLHIWITGASRGIGASITHELASGNNLSLSGRNEASLTQIAELANASSCTIVPCDVADYESVRQAHRAAVEANGPVDVLINNAGIGIFRDLADMTVEEFDDQIAINLRGVFLCTKSVLPTMLESKSGLIVTINSVAATTTFTGSTGYGASKAGVLALTRSLRAEVRDQGIKVCDVLVGATETDIWTEGAREEHAHRMMQSEDVAKLIGDVVNTFEHPRTHIEEIVVRPQRGDL